MSVSAKIVIAYEEYRRLLSIAEKYEALITEQHKGKKPYNLNLVLGLYLRQETLL